MVPTQGATPKENGYKKVTKRERSTQGEGGLYKKSQILTLPPKLRMRGVTFHLMIDQQTHFLEFITIIIILEFRGREVLVIKFLCENFHPPFRAKLTVFTSKVNEWCFCLYLRANAPSSNLSPLKFYSCVISPRQP